MWEPRTFAVSQSKDSSMPVVATANCNHPDFEVTGSVILLVYLQTQYDVSFQPL
jgi:hypothetical protein